MNYDDLLRIISLGSFSSLIGETENVFFDVKRDVYPLTDDPQKLEFAKDISAFANANGGVIFLGIDAKENSLHLGGEVTTIVPFQSDRVDVKQYYGLIKEWIYPIPKNIDVKWVENESTPRQGIICITIPKQDDALRPFLITKNFIDDARRKGMLFGYAERTLDRSDHLTHNDLQRFLHAGMFYEKNLDARLSNLEKIALQTRYPEAKSKALAKKMNGDDRDSRKQTIPHTFGLITKGNPGVSPLASRVREILSFDEMKEKRFLILSASVENSELMTIFASPDDEKTVAYKLAHPAALRRDGWSLETLGSPQIIEGEFLRVTNRSRKVLDLYRDGTLIFAASAEDEFLSWGREFSADNQLNPLAMIETIYNFARFYREMIIPDLNRKVERYTVRTDIYIPSGRILKLPPYGINSLIGRHETQEAPKHTWLKETTALFESQPELVAFKMAKEIYLWFGFDESKIPYTKIENGHSVIDKEQILGPH